MKKLVASALVAAALAVPAGSVQAAEPSAPVGTNECPQAGPGRVVWYYDYVNKQYRYYKLCIYTGP